MACLGLLAGITNYLLGMLLILPFMAIPFVTVITLLDSESEPKQFGIGYVIGTILTCLVIHH